ncbi:MAG: RQC domain protein, partial [Anaerolineae bacterium]|nr:RQC domain protein [Anaerolineae bacterium]
MSRKKYTRVSYTLDAQDVKDLPLEEIRAILRGADNLVMTGGRSM